MANMKMRALLVMLVVVCSTCVSINRKSSDPCQCKDDHKPVCGINGKTYENDCTMECSGMVKHKDGACPECDNVDDTFSPVCGKSGFTYDNKFKAKCLGVEVAYHWQCQK